MSASVVEVVFVIDASASMRPCFQSLIGNLERLLAPLQAGRFRVRLGMVTLGVGKSTTGGPVFNLDTLAGSGFDALDTIYARGGQGRLFTESPAELTAALGEVSLQGDENSLVALDLALDFPFGPVARTRRVVALFSDERIEDGAVKSEEIARIPDLIAKIADRRVLLFAAMPDSPALEVLGSTDGSQIQSVRGGDGLGSVDFGKLMDQMAKSISVMSQQHTEQAGKRALFGQDRWVPGHGDFEGLR